MELNVDDEWEQFMSSSAEENATYDTNIMSSQLDADNCPKATDIYISTKTNIAYLNEPVDLKRVFWEIPVMKYGTPKEGVIKKQMKFNSVVKEDLDDIVARLENEYCVEQNILTSIDNPTGRIKFKDIRKVSIGISKKDILSYRSKKKSAFYNCFVVILRIRNDNTFKEFHVKVFNTGKLEIPGIQTDKSFNDILDMVVSILSPYFETPICVLPDKTQTVLINSNFNCGFFINREVLFDILRTKYNIECIYDPCSYPGIQSKFYYDKHVIIQSGAHQPDKENDNNVSFMIFRTGSVLIVGKCEENVLRIIYEFLKKLLIDEFSNIGTHIIGDASEYKNKNKNTKIRKKTIVMETGAETSV